MTSLNGPFVQAAVFCDDVMQEAGGRITALRLLTDVKISAVGPSMPDAMPALKIPLTLLIVLNAGGRAGNYELRVNVLAPDGNTREGPSGEVELIHETFTMNVITKLEMQFHQPGQYWFEIVLEGRAVLRLPLNVTYEFQSDSKTENSLPPAADASPKSPLTH